MSAMPALCGDLQTFFSQNTTLAYLLEVLPELKTNHPSLALLEIAP